MRIQAQQAGIRLELVQADGPLPMVLDVERLEQVVANLVGNALKFTPEGGTVRVTLRREAHDAWLVVHDSGMGIEPEDLPRLFEMFYQANVSSRRARGGAGLGLAVAKAIVEAHGGVITVDSEIGQGTRFTIRMPLVEPVSSDDALATMIS
jgi:signal transduction histidine kinase